MDVPAYGGVTARAAETIPLAPIGDGSRRPVDRDMADLPGRQAAVAPQEGNMDVTADGQPFGRPDRHRAPGRHRSHRSSARWCSGTAPWRSIDYAGYRQ